jgi:hypothetical protein
MIKKTQLRYSGQTICMYFENQRNTKTQYLVKHTVFLHDIKVEDTEICIYVLKILPSKQRNQ